MDSNLINPQNPQKFHQLIGENYDIAVNKSIQDLLHSHNRDCSAFASAFYELMQARANPPLETIWVYSALTFRCSISLNDEPSNRVSATRDLFQLISSCSASSSSSKSIVLLGPVLCEVCRVIVDLKGEALKRERKLMREIRSLVNSILGYISVCCSENDGGLGLGSDLGSDLDDFVWPIEDLIRVWIGDKVDKTSQPTEVFKFFFPLLGVEIVRRLSVEGSGLNELAGVVIAEAFLLKLCLDFGSVDSKLELQKELSNWAVGSITGIRNFYFVETIVRMLLEDTLPVTFLLSSEEEFSVRTVLFDALISVEYSFLTPDELIHLPTNRITSLAVARVLVAHEATELFRGKGKQKKALSYVNAFSGSQLPSQTIKLVTNEIGTDNQAGQPKGSSPKALLKWLLKLEDQGIRLLDDGFTKYKSRLASHISEADYEQLAYNTEGTKPNSDLVFYIDSKGEEDENEDDEMKKESINAAFLAAAHTMTSTDNGGGRKRKEGRSVGKRKHVKFLKHNLYDNSGSTGEKSTSLRNDGSSSGSEVENPHLDEDIDEETEK